jgi:hypothetical protein
MPFLPKHLRRDLFQGRQCVNKVRDGGPTARVESNCGIIRDTHQHWNCRPCLATKHGQAIDRSERLFRRGFIMVYACHQRGNGMLAIKCEPAQGHSSVLGEPWIVEAVYQYRYRGACVRTQIIHAADGNQRLLTKAHVNGAIGNHSQERRQSSRPKAMQSLDGAARRVRPPAMHDSDQVWNRRARLFSQNGESRKCHFRPVIRSYHRLPNIIHTSLPMRPGTQIKSLKLPSGRGITDPAHQEWQCIRSHVPHSRSRFPHFRNAIIRVGGTELQPLAEGFASVFRLGLPRPHQRRHDCDHDARRNDHDHSSSPFHTPIMSQTTEN